MFPDGLNRRLKQLFRLAKFDGGAVSKSTPVVEVVQTWNNASEVFTALKVDVTDKASASDSRLADFGGKAYVRKDGVVMAVAGSSTTNSFGAASANGHGVSIGAAHVSFLTNDGGGLRAGLLVSKYNVMVQKTFGVFWHSTGAPTDQNGGDVGVNRDSAGVMKITSDGTSLRDLKLRSQIATGSISTGVTAVKTASFTVSVDDGLIPIDSTSGDITVTLETAVGHNRIHAFKKVAGGNAVTIDGNASETIDGSLSITLTDRAILQSDGANWKQIA